MLPLFFCFLFSSKNLGSKNEVTFSILQNTKINYVKKKKITKNKLIIEQQQPGEELKGEMRVCGEKKKKEKKRERCFYRFYL